MPSLALRAAAVGEGENVWAILDARKGRVYAQRFRVAGGLPLALGPVEDVRPEAIAAAVSTTSILVGEGSPLVEAHLAGRVPAAALPPEAFVRAGGPLCARLPDLDAAALAPIYHRDPDARPSR